MDLRQLEMFLSVVETGSYAQAGQRLHVAHSAVHRQVRLLGEEIGEKLLYREGGRVCLTRGGREIAELARRVLKDIANVTHQLRDDRSLSSGHVLLGTGTTMFVFFLPKVLERFRSKYPHVQVQVMTGTGTEVLASIRDGSLDLGIVFAPHFPEPNADGLRFAPLYKEEFVLIVPESMSFGGQKALRTKELHGLPAITFSRTSRIRQFIESQIASQGVQMKVMMELENEEAIEKMVRINQGVAFISKSRAVAGGFRFFQIKDLNLLVTASAVSSARIPMTRAAAEFLSTCLQGADTLIVNRPAKRHRNSEKASPATRAPTAIT